MHLFLILSLLLSLSCSLFPILSLLLSLFWRLAKVYVATNRKTKEKVAIKVISLKLVKGKEDSILTEINIMKRVNHPNIVRLIEFFNDSKHDTMYLICEL